MLRGLQHLQLLMGIDTGVIWGMNPSHDLLYTHTLYIIPIIEKMK